MTPLKTFQETITLLAKKPFLFWDEETQNSILNKNKTNLSSILSQLEKKSLTETLVYKSAKKTFDFIETFEELEFLQSLDNLIDMYLQSFDNKVKAQALSIKTDLTRAKRNTLEYHLSLERIAQKIENMDEKEQHDADHKHLQNVGIFYVLEYTLQVLYEFTQISDEDKVKLLNTGLKTKAGNLPGYLPLEDSFRQELCLKIYNENLRKNLLLAFYEFEECLTAKIDLKKFGSALKTFNLRLLTAFENEGFEIFKALVYKPFGNDISLNEISSKINQLII